MSENTATAVRRLAYTQYTRMPDGDDAAVVGWALEQLISLAHDFDDALLPITGARVANPAVNEAAFEFAVEELRDLADEIARVDEYVARNGDDWQAPRATVIDEYEDALGRLVRLVRAAS